MRRLLTSRRHVPLDRVEDYLRLWTAVRRAAEAAGAHAWLFRERRRQDHFIEFLESRELERIIENAVVVEARDALDAAFGGGSMEEWEEATAP